MDRILLALLELQRRGIERLPTVNYDSRANQLGDIILDRSLKGMDVVWEHRGKTVRRAHQLKDLITWQETVSVSNLISLSVVSNIQGLMLLDVNCFVLQYNDLKVVREGNHRFWWLSHQGYTQALFNTLDISFL